MKAWIEQLVASPVEAVESLVMGQADVGVFSRASVGEVFAEACRQHRLQFDEGIHGFLVKHLLEPVPAPLKAQVWGAYLQDVFRGIATLGLVKTGALLRTRHPAFRRWLRGFFLGEALDPESAFLRALAWAQTNHLLLPLWRRLVLGQEGRGMEYVEAGLLGLRKLRGPKGEAPEDVPTTLLTALVDLADVPTTSESWWKRKVRSLQAAYRCPDDVWQERLKHTVQSRPNARRAADWLASLYSSKLAASGRSAKRMAKTPFLRPPAMVEVDRFAHLVARQGPAAAGSELDSFLNRERDYAGQSGDGYFLDRTFNRLANAGMRHDPVWALGLVEEALTWVPNDHLNWVVKARCLEAAQRDNEAIETLWAARLRLPQFPHVHTELGRMLRAGGDLGTSQVVYEEALASFPDNVAVATGVAEVQAELGQVDAAVRTYREVVGHWKTNAFARSGLAKLLMQRRHPGDHEEAESLLRDSTRLFPDEVFLWTALAELLKDLGRYDEAAEVAYASVRQFPGNPVCCNILGEVRFIQGLKQGGDMALKEEARKWFEKAAELGDYHARQRLETLDSRWNRQIDRHGEGAAVPGVRQRELMQRRLKFEATESRWSPAQRLGRALLAQGQALRASNPAQKAELFERAKRLLLLSDQEADEYLSAFIEARGFLLLAQGKAQEALGYFKEQMDCYGRAAWAGVQLGYAEARLRTGEVVSPSEWRRLSALGPDGAVTSLVARVVLWLADEGDEELRSALLELYPQAAQAPHPDDETSRPSSLLLGWVNERWFKPAGIAQQADLHDAAKLADVRQLAKASAPELQQPFESVQLALAA